MRTDSKEMAVVGLAAGVKAWTGYKNTREAQDTKIGFLGWK